MVKSNYITEHRKGQHLLSEERMKSKGGLGQIVSKVFKKGAKYDII